MRKILATAVLMLFATVVVLADGDDHNDGAPVQSGYAVVTPTSAATTGLVAFETFGWRGFFGLGLGATQAGVLPPGLTTSAIIVADSSHRLSKNLGVAIVNPNGSDISVTLTLRKSDGTSLGTTSIPVPSHKQVSKFVTELFPNQLTTDFLGSLTITSDGSSPLPFSAIGLRFRGLNFSTLPATSLTPLTTALPTIATGVGGAGAILLPQFVAGGGWASEIVIANTGTSSITVRVDLFKSDGSLLTTALNGQSANSFTNLTVPAGGVIELAPRDSDGDDDF
jgi:hypothetical protein